VKIVPFSKISYHTSFQDPTLILVSLPSQKFIQLSCWCNWW